TEFAKLIETDTAVGDDEQRAALDKALAAYRAERGWDKEGNERDYPSEADTQNAGELVRQRVAPLLRLVRAVFELVTAKAEDDTKTTSAALFAAWASEQAAGQSPYPRLEQRQFIDAVFASVIFHTLSALSEFSPASAQALITNLSSAAIASPDLRTAFVRK